ITVAVACSSAGRCFSTRSGTATPTITIRTRTTRLTRTIIRTIHLRRTRRRARSRDSLRRKPRKRRHHPRRASGRTAPGSCTARIGTYGLVQLHGVPDGAAVDLDGRFWLTADGLDDRWLALPEGSHTIAVRVGNGTPLKRTVEVKPGASTVVRFPSSRRG